MVNRNRLLWAGFTAILAAGVGFSIRGGILDNWGAEYGFTGGQLGNLNGAGFTGFCFGIIIGGVIADRIGYGKLVITAFVLHAVSALVTFAANKDMKMETAYSFIYWAPSSSRSRTGRSRPSPTPWSPRSSPRTAPTT
jgi:MFS family permease